MDWLKNLLGQWSFKTFAGKFVKRAVVAVIAWLLAAEVGGFSIGKALQDSGISPAELQNFLTVSIWAALEALRNWLKTRFNLGWL
jgi:heme-degrading monooxygenase HmoA